MEPTNFERIKTLLTFLENYAKESVPMEDFLAIEMIPLHARIINIEEESSLTLEIVQEIAEKVDQITASNTGLTEVERERLYEVFNEIQKTGKSYTEITSKDIDLITEKIRGTQTVERVEVQKDTLEERRTWERVTLAAKEQLSIVQEIKRKEYDTLDTSLTDEGNKEEEEKVVTRQSTDIVGSLMKFLKGDMLTAIKMLVTGLLTTSLGPIAAGVAAIAGIGILLNKYVVEPYNNKIEKNEDAKAKAAKHFAGEDSLRILTRGFDPQSSFVNDGYHITDSNKDYIANFSKIAEKGYDIDSMTKQDERFDPDMSTLEGAQAYVARYYAMKNVNNKRGTEERKRVSSFYKEMPGMLTPFSVKKDEPVNMGIPQDKPQGYIEKSIEKSNSNSVKETSIEKEEETNTKTTSKTNITSTVVNYTINAQKGGITE